MPEIRTIGISEIRNWNGLAPLSIPTAPPVTVNIGTPIVDMPEFNPMDYRPTELVFDPVAPLPETSTPETPQAPTPATPNLPKPKAKIDEDPRSLSGGHLGSSSNRKRRLTRILGAPH